MQTRQRRDIRKWRKLIPLAGILLLEGLYGCVDEMIIDDNVQELVWITDAGGVSTGNCSTNNAKVTTLSVGLSYDVESDQMTASGSWSVSGANGIRLVHYIDGDDFQIDDTQQTGINGGWNVHSSGFGCYEYEYKVCGYPRITSSSSDTVCTDRPKCVTRTINACPYPIGVIPNSTSSPYCPAGVEVVTIHMDDENKSNNNSRSPWYGGITNNSDTTFRFCKTKGSKFKPLTSGSSTDIQYHYAVLRLGASCPPNSTAFSRYIDNQDDLWLNPNDNYNSGNIWPNMQGINTLLEFCLFRNGPSSGIMQSFPYLGYAYGVFAGPVFSRYIGTKGYVHSDDEDNDNDNWTDPYNYYFNLIVEPGSDTTFHTARVR